MINEKNTIAQIKNEYLPHEETKAEKIKQLDKKVKLAPTIWACIAGSVSALVFGTGMCLAMKVIGASLSPVIGIAVGVAGMGMCAANYFAYKAVLKKRKQKYGEEIIALCNEALGE